MTETPDRFALDQWYVIASALELPAGRPRRTELMDRPILAARGAEGTVAVHEISETGELLRDLPAQERYGYVWTTLGGPNKPLFAMPEFEEPGRRLVTAGCVTVRCSGLRAVENFLEWLSLPNKALANKTPLSLLKTKYGTDMVMDVLVRIQHGVFS